MDKAQNKAKKFGSTMKTLGGAIAGAFAARRILRGITDVINAFSVQEEAVISLGAALEVTGKQGAENLDLITRRAAELQQVTTKGDEAIIAATSSLALLATELSAADLARAQEALIGIADSFLKGDVENAALLVGKSIGSTTNALTRYGINLDTAATQQEKLDAVMEQSARFFEVSKRRTDSIAGATGQLSNAFGDLKESIGEMLGEESGLKDFLQSVTGVISDITAVIDAESVTIGEAFGILGEIAGTAFVDKFFSVYSTIPERMEEILEANKIVSILTQPLQLQLKLLDSTIGAAAETIANEAKQSMEDAIAELRELAIAAGKILPPRGDGGAAGDIERRLKFSLETPVLAGPQRVIEAAASVNTLLDAAIVHSRQMATGFEEGAQRMKTASDWVLQGFDEMAIAAGIFKDRTARLVVQGIGAIIESLAGENKFLTGLGQGLQQFQTGGVVRGPTGSPQLAMVHAGETVIPRGGGMQPVVINQSIAINAAGPIGFDWWESQKGAVAKVVGEAARESVALRRAFT
jgi:hypothetical protein